MHRIGVAEEVVHIAQYLLVGSHQEHTYIIVVIQAYGMQRDIVCLLSAIHVGRDLAVAVAGDVLQCGAARRLLVEA